MEGRLAIVVCLPRSPVRGTGGAYGAAYLLLRGLVSLGLSHDVYFLPLGTGRPVRVATSNDVEAIVREINREKARLLARLKTQEWIWRRIEDARLRRALGLARRGRERALAVLARLQRQYSRVVVHCHEVTSASVIARLLSSLERTRLVFTEHSQGGLLRYGEQVFESRWPDHPLYRELKDAYCQAISLSSRLVFPSNGARSAFETYGMNPRLNPSKVSIVPNGIEDPLETLNGVRAFDVGPRFSEKDRVLISVAQHHPDKGLDTVLEVLGIVRRREPQLDWMYTVIGGFSALTPRLQRLAKQLGIGDRVRFAGYLPHPATLSVVAESSMFITLPRVTVFDLALLEAMGLGKAVVTNLARGNLEALGEDYPAVASSIEDLATLVLGLLRNEEGLTNLGRRNRARFVAHYTLGAMARRYVDLYELVAFQRG
ncbi:glycosyltransferase family 4 protein [Geochorda subterranea]|uniref:Glycosyltransferase family 4 protein n=1 Tax=Geochorda subterranea TaxID=3109564 RepID=A0ABZ1BLW2_9FIRM|nr:glycosyltransferase family 4 protein [Limnochorda sp. LNt]WRP13729.1 glycosyltransferase family 4 protein [Limnochorda sp. LNt]